MCVVKRMARSPAQRLTCDPIKQIGNLMTRKDLLDYSTDPAIATHHGHTAYLCPINKCQAPPCLLPHCAWKPEQLYIILSSCPGRERYCSVCSAAVFSSVCCGDVMLCVSKCKCEPSPCLFCINSFLSDFPLIRIELIQLVRPGPVWSARTKK